MDSIIAAHLPDFETWQSSCLLFESRPYNIVKDKISLLDKIVYESGSYFEKIIQNDELKMTYHNSFEYQSGYRIYTRKLEIILPPNEHGLKKCITYDYQNGYYSIDYLLNDLKHGTCFVYYMDGKIYFKMNYKHGKGDGECLEYYINGKLKYQYNRINGQLHGKYISYYENGNIRIEENYEHGKLHGRCISYYENGQIEKERNYEHGKLYGRCISYYKNGQIEKDCNFERGKLHGRCISYYENGNIKEEAYYKHDMVDRIENITLIMK